MAVELTPITDADIADVADFLRVNMNPKVTWARACVPPWKVDAPNHGFMLRDGQRVVGVQLAFYSERLVAGRAERFCNMGAWCVLPEYRFHSIRLVMAAAGPGWLPLHRLYPHGQDEGHPRPAQVPSA